MANKVAAGRNVQRGSNFAWGAPRSLRGFIAEQCATHEGYGNSVAHCRDTCLRTCLLITLGLLVAACGGGSGGGSDPSGNGDGGGNGTQPPPTFTVGGTVNGLQGSGLQLEFGDVVIDITANGPFVIHTGVESGTDYEVTVRSQPSSPAQQCTISNGSGTVQDANVTDIDVACTNISSSTHTIRGMVANLEGEGLVLQNHGGDDLPILEDGHFTFETAILGGRSYNVTVASHPSNPDQTCLVENGQGLIVAADISDIIVTCYDRLSFSAMPGIMQMHLSWEHPDPITILYSSDPDCDLNNYSLCPDSGMLPDVSGGELNLQAIDDPLVPEGFDSDTGWYFVALSGSARSEQFGARPAPPSVRVRHLDPAMGSLDAGPPWGRVNALATGHDRLFVGGRFSRIGPNTGAGVMLTADDGVPIGALPTVHVPGLVQAVVSDGTGGWYIGGTFQKVGQYDRFGLARIRPDGSVDPKWNTRVIGSATALAVHDGRVYAGGGFGVGITEIGGPEAYNTHLVALDAVTGELDHNWQPEIDFEVVNHEAVRTLVVHENRVYVGGAFSSVAGEPRAYLAAFDAETGALIEDWIAEVDGRIGALVESNRKLYVGGEFSMANGEPRNNLAAFDLGTGELDEDWKPDAIKVGFDPGPLLAPPIVSALAVSNERIYAGGRFDFVNGEPRNLLGAFDLDDGSLSSGWNTNVPALDAEYVAGLSVLHGRIYAGGQFGDTVGSIGRPNLAAFDEMTGELVEAWNPGTDGAVLAIAAGRNEIYAGGAFHTAGGEHRQNLAAFHARTGVLDQEWTANISGLVNALTLSGGRLLVGGQFVTTDLFDSGVIALDATSGELDHDWYRLPIAGFVLTLGNSDELVYAGGVFGTLDGSFDVTYNLIALDASTGIPDATWNAGASNPFPAETGSLKKVNTLAVGESRIYVGGLFSSVSGTPKDNLAAFDRVTGIFQPAWEAGVNDEVLTLSTHDGRVYAGGRFTQAGDDPRQAIAAFDVMDGTLDNQWTPILELIRPVPEHPVVLATAALDDRIYTWGKFNLANSEDRFSLAAFGVADGSLVEHWNPLPQESGTLPPLLSVAGAPDQLLPDDDLTYVGSDRNFVNFHNHPPRIGILVVDTQSGEVAW